MTTSKRSPAAAQAGSISAALPTSAIEIGLARPRPPRGPSARASAGIAGQPVDVADVEPPPGAGLVDLDREADAVVHRHGERLGAAHPAEAGGQRRPARAASRRSAAARASAKVSYVPWRIPWVPM